MRNEQRKKTLQTDMKKIIILIIASLTFISAMGQKQGRAIQVPITVSTRNISLLTNDTVRVVDIDTINMVAGDNIAIEYQDNGVITISTLTSLPTCAEGEFLAYIGGEWTCVNVCDYICADTIINIINNYNDTVPQKIEPSGDVTINFARLDCLDSVQIFAADFVKKTNNLTNIRITSVPSIGELHYNGVAVLANDVLNVVQGTFENDLYYVADETTGSQHVDPFSFQALYSSNQDYSGTFAVNVSVSECVEESVCFGYLYNWYAVSDVRELTSSADWSAPTLTDLFDIQAYLGGADVAGGKLKTTGTLFWNDPNTGATNETGFSAKGGGNRAASGGSFTSIQLIGKFWSSTVGAPTTNANVLLLSNSNDNTFIGQNAKGDGFSVRLIKDATGIPDGTTTTYTGNDGKTYNAIAINELYWTTENLEETKYRNGDYIQGYDGGVYTPIDNATWAGLTTGALCVYNDDLNNACKTVALTEYCYTGLYVCGDPLHEIAGHEPYTGSITYTDAFGISRTEYYCADDGDITISSSTTPITVGMTTCTP